MFVLCVLYSKDKRQSQGNQDTQARTKYKARTKKIPVGARCSAPVYAGLLQNGHGALFLEIKWPGSGVNHPPPSSAPKENSHTSTHLCAFMVCSRAIFTFTLLPRRPVKLNEGLHKVLFNSLNTKHETMFL